VLLPEKLGPADLNKIVTKLLLRSPDLNFEGYHLGLIVCASASEFKGYSFERPKMNESDKSKLNRLISVQGLSIYSAANGIDAGLQFTRLSHSCPPAKTSGTKRGRNAKLVKSPQKGVQNYILIIPIEDVFERPDLLKAYAL
jgi:hypothetical protein